jgi:hypothetical protein
MSHGLLSVAHGAVCQYPRRNLWRKNNASLVGYYANKYGLLLVARLDQSAGRPRWATSSSPW